MSYLGKLFDRKYGSLILLFASLFVFPLLFLTKPRTEQPKIVIPINNASMPPCVDDINKLPIFLITANMRAGIDFRGTAFLIDDETWVTAAHVIDGDVEEMLIHTPTANLIATLQSVDVTNDIAILTTRSVPEYDPLSVKFDDLLFMEDIWNVGYPGWAGMNEVISSGKVFGHSSIGMLYTSATVMQGMSGGPTLSCNGPIVEVSSVISMFAKELFSETTLIIDGVQTVEKVYINTGDSFSARLNQTDHIKSLQESKTYVTISHK